MDKFKTSSFCEKGKCCVEVAINENVVLIKNSKNPKNIIKYTLPEWKDFIKGVKNNEFNID